MFYKSEGAQARAQAIEPIVQGTCSPGKLGIFDSKRLLLRPFDSGFEASIIYRVRYNIGNYNYTLKIEGSTPTAFKVRGRGELSSSICPTPLFLCLCSDDVLLSSFTCSLNGASIGDKGIADVLSVVKTMTTLQSLE